MDKATAISPPASGVQTPAQPDDECAKPSTTSDGEGVALQRGYINHIIVECSLEDGKHPALEQIRMVVIGSNDDNIGGSLKRSSQTTWEYRSNIELCTNSNLVFVVQSGNGDDVGRLRLTKEELESYVKVASSTDVEHELVVEVDSPSLSLKFAISGMKRDQEAAVSLPLTEDSPTWMETMLLRFQEGHVAEVCDSMRRPQEEILDMFGVEFTSRFKKTGDIDDISKAIEYGQRAVALTPEGHTDMPTRLHNLGAAFLHRIERRGDLEDILNVIEYQQRAVVLTPEGHAKMPLRLHNLSASFLRCFERTGDLEDISKAIENQQRAIALTPEGHASMPMLLNNLGAAFQSRFKQTGDLDDISAAIEYQRRAVTLTPDTPSGLNNLGNLLKCRFERTGNLDDISGAIDYQQRAVALTPEGYVYMPIFLNNLGNSFQTRFKRMGELDDIFKATCYQERAVALTPEGHPNMPQILNNLATSFVRCFERTGDLEDISKASEYQQRAIAVTPKSHANMPTLLNNLANSVFRRFERTGNFDEISEVIEYQQRSIALTPQGHADMPLLLNGLGTTFCCRFERTGNLDDIHKAIEYQQHTVALTPENHADMPSWLNNLGILLMRRFERTGNPDDISKAVEYQQRAIMLAPAGHANMPSWLNSLGLSWGCHFDQTDNVNDISTAIEYQQRAVALAPEGHADKPSWLNNLGGTLTSRFEKTGELDDILTAIETLQRAVALHPEGHAKKPKLYINLGYSFVKCFQRTSALEDCKAAVLNFRLAATQVSGSPSVRLGAAKQWAHASISLGDPAQSLQAYTVAFELLSLVAGLDQTIRNRHSNLRNISDFTSEGVLFAITNEHMATALEWLEQGRCVVWSQLNQLRSPVEDLQAYDAPLADHFLTVSKMLEVSGSRPEESSVGRMSIAHHIKIEDQARTHVKLAQEWEQLLSRIRNIPNFHDFLRPRKTASILSQLSPEGPIVIINCHAERCDALALIHGRDDVLHIPLKDFTYDEVEELRQDLRSYLTPNGLLMRDDRAMTTLGNETSKNPLRRILRILWEGIVKPILDALGYCSIPLQRNRIWWCPTGPLTFLPIHAAGIYGCEATSPGMCLSDYAVSSYIPTVNTLLEKLRNSGKASKSNPKFLLVSQPNVPRLPRLPSIPGTTTETQAIQKRMLDNNIGTMRLEGKEATTGRVEEELKSHQWVHFACHASQHPTDPLKSGFYLHDRELELMGLMRQDLPMAEFAFLSACETSVGDENLSDEAVHLAAGMLAAGYQGVVATMWSIKDGYAPKISEEFYGHLLKERKDSESHQLNNNRAVYALDQAIQKIRNELPDDEYSLLTWVPYVHYGL